MEEFLMTLEANTADKYVKYEYEAQHFGFTPITFINGMYNTVCDLYRDALLAFFTKLSEKYPGIASEEVTKARHAVGRMIDQQINHTFDKLEVFLLENVFTIPDECVLPRDMCQLNSKKLKEEKGPLQDKITELRKRIIALKYANAVLSKQLKHGEAFNEQLKSILKNYKSLAEVTGGQNMKDYLSYFSDSILTAFKKSRE